MKETLLKRLRAEKKKNIVIYGMPQKKCKLSKNETASFQFYYMDLDIGPKQNEIVQTQLFSLEQAEKCGIDAFVIMRQMIAHRGTFCRLMEYCEIHGADIYDENGHNLGRICKNALKKTPDDKMSILEMVQQHECISFDIFDTLLTRKILLPEDVFELMARRLELEGVVIRNFKEKRCRAQEKLGLTNPDIYEIYEMFRKMYKISEEVADMCCRMELEVEDEVLIPRAEMVRLYQECLKMGKKVCLVSDMYIPANVLVPILDKNGIRGYDALYISCDKKQLKLQGLLETYRKECQGESYLHIGDHYIYDGICAELAGMDYCLVESSMKMAERTAFKQCMKKAGTLEEHVMLGMIIAKIMNNPFSQNAANGKIDIASDYDYSYGFCAALISQFALWIYYKVKEEKYDEVLFASRDGYLMQKMYEVLLNIMPDGSMPKGKYFYTSRKAAVMTGINNEAFINMIIDISSGMPPEKMMRERFGLSAAQILEYDEAKYGDSIHKYVWAHKDAIFERAETAKQNYFKYVGNIDLQIGRKCAFMDFVSSGTSQKALKRILPFGLQGLYAGWNGSESMEDLGVQALFADKDTFFMRRFKLMETFLTSEEPSLDCFDGKGNPIFAYQDRTDDELRYIREMQRACMDFLKDFMGLVKPEENSVSVEFTDRVFAVSEHAKRNDPDSILNHLRLMDDWRKKRNRLEELFSDRVGESQMAELLVPGREIEENMLTACEQKEAELIMQHSGNDYNDVLRDAGWDMFYQLSPMREGILNWYPFRKDCQILQLSSGFGALTGMLARIAKRLTVLEKSTVRAECIAQRYEENQNITIIAGEWDALSVNETYDYVVVEETVKTSYEIEELFKMACPFLKENGRILFVCENRFGMKYWCGVPDPIHGQPFAGIRGRQTEGMMTRQELIEILEQSRQIAGWNIYYPFPDHKLPQAIYSDQYLPGVSVRDRVIPYYLPEERSSLVCLENEISDELIANGVFHVFANSFLVECSRQNFSPEVRFAALSTDRGLEHGFATVILNRGIVQKKILHPNGRRSLALIYQNQQELEQHGISCVPGELLEDAIEMPFIQGSTLIEYLKQLFLNDNKKVEEVFEKLYEAILSSSEHVPFSQCAIKDKRLTNENTGVILKKAYIDMIPYNSFYKDGQILFYDQEFVKEYFPAKYILFRALRYTYIYIPEAEDMIPLQFFKEKYGLEQLWQVFEQEEAQFVEDNRNYDIMTSFYQWARITPKEVDANIDKLKMDKPCRKRVPFKRHKFDLSIYKKNIQLNAVKAVQLQLLREIDRVCRENDLSYCVFYGTLLGAVRHKGYVPWDDDVDILMPRADYDRLTEIAPEVFGHPYFLQTPESDAECFYGGYGKLRNSNTAGIEQRNEGHHCNQGIWIDIFPLDFLPADEKQRNEQKERIEIWQRLLFKKTYPEKRMLWELSVEEEENFIRMSRCLTREMICQNLHSAITDYGYAKSDKVAILARYYADKGKYKEYDGKDFEFLIKRKFEDVEVYIPVGYENCLLADYGEDYALYPPETERVPHHDAFFDTAKSYIDYVAESGYNKLDCCERQV